MKTPVLKDIIQGTAEITSVTAGGKIEYVLTDIHNDCWQLLIDVSDKHDVGETATFMAHEKPIYLMRWIRKAINEGTLYPTK